MIPITPSLSLDDDDIEERFVRASGPGGQNVNKVATAVQLRLDVGGSSLPEDVKERLRSLAGNRLTADGILVIDSREHRTQAQNRAAARERLVALIRCATVRPRTRRPTRPGSAAREERLVSKKHRAEVKASRRPRQSPDD
jgi:ribosome-associated protein